MNIENELKLVVLQIALKEEEQKAVQDTKLIAFLKTEITRRKNESI